MILDIRPHLSSALRGNAWIRRPHCFHQASSDRAIPTLFTGEIS